MEIDPEAPGGKIKCPGCKEVVGEYAWLGLQCEDCGEIVSPGLALVKRGNVELLQFPATEEAVGIRSSDGQDVPPESAAPELDSGPEKCETERDHSPTEVLTPAMDASKPTEQPPVPPQVASPLPKQQRPNLMRRPSPLSRLSIPGIARFLPSIPSPLRHTWFPRSSSSSPSSSQLSSQFSSQSCSQESYQSSNLTNTQLDDTIEETSSQNETAQEEGTDTWDDDWLNIGRNFPTTTQEVVELVQEYLGGSEM